MRNDRWILLIGLLKLFKGLLLLASGIGLLKLLHKDVAAVAMQWVNTLHVDPDNRYIQHVLLKTSLIDERKLKELSLGSFFYAGLLLTEGTGLLLRKRWGKYFSVIVTGSFIPLEIWELAKRFSAAKTIVIAVNVAVVGYLIRKIREE